MCSMACDEQARILMRFFKTGPGQYGDGDKFLGIRVPQTRMIVKEHKNNVQIDDVRTLILSDYHEIRLCGFLLLIELYKAAKRKKKEDEIKFFIDFYLSVLDRGNNWDLVDVVAPKLLGDWILNHPQDTALLYDLALADGKLWHQRVSIVATWTLIHSGQFRDTLRLAEIMLHHKQDLIHKAVGWMLREVGKCGGMDQLIDFLDKHASQMPRTMLRYAIEHLSASERKHYMLRSRL